jgi:hypothetical protein
MSAFGNLGFEILDTVTGVVDSIGAGFTNKSDADAAKIKYLNAQTGIASLKAQAEAENMRKVTQAIIMIVYVIVFAAVALMAAKQFKK